MGKLIDTDAFDKRIRLAVGSCEEELTEDFKDGISTILEMMKTAPTVDAVPVIRCKDCIRFFPDDDVWGWCTVSGKMRCKDYCSYGVRKDGGDEQTKKSE